MTTFHNFLPPFINQSSSTANTTTLDAFLNNDAGTSSKAQLDTFVEAARRGEYKGTVLNNNQVNESSYVRHEILNSREKSHWHPNHHKQRFSEMIGEAKSVQDSGKNVKVFLKKMIESMKNSRSPEGARRETDILPPNNKGAVPTLAEQKKKLNCELKIKMRSRASNGSVFYKSAADNSLIIQDNNNNETLVNQKPLLKHNPYTNVNQQLRASESSMVKISSIVSSQLATIKAGKSFKNVDNNNLPAAVSQISFANILGTNKTQLGTKKGGFPLNNTSKLQTLVDRTRNYTKIEQTTRDDITKAENSQLFANPQKQTIEIEDQESYFYTSISPSPQVRESTKMRISQNNGARKFLISPPVTALKNEKMQVIINSGKLEKIPACHRASESFAFENIQKSMNLKSIEAKSIDLNQIKSNFQTISAMRVQGVKDYQNIDLKHRGLIKPYLGPPSFRDLYEQPQAENIDELIFGETQYNNSFNKQNIVRSGLKLKDNFRIRQLEEQTTIALNPLFKIQSRAAAQAKRETSQEKFQSSSVDPIETLPKINQAQIDVLSSPNPKFRIPPIHTNSQRFSIELKWLQKVNPQFYEREKLRDEQDIKQIINKRKNIQINEAMYAQQLQQSSTGSNSPRGRKN